MTEKLDRCLSEILAGDIEGGDKYTDRAGDLGGPTKWGITQKTLQDWRGKYVSADDVKNLGYAEARDIYEANYFKACRCEDLPLALALLVFGMAVNQGSYRARKCLQESLRVKADGVIGPVTLKAVRRADLTKLLREFCSRRCLLYAHTKTFNVNGHGWFRRVFKMHRIATQIISQEELRL